MSHRHKWDWRFRERATLGSTGSQDPSPPTGAVVAAVAGGRGGRGVGMRRKDAPGNADRLPGEDGDG